MDKRTIASLPQKESRMMYWILLFVVIVLGAYLRFNQPISSEFPINDGGMFYIMAEDIQKLGYQLPEYTSFNHAHLPFYYPPLPFYILATLADITHGDFLDVLRLLPPFLSVLTIPAFYFLSKEFQESKIQTLISAYAFALLLPAYEWLVMGGGITRAPSTLFAIMSIAFSYRLYKYQQTRYILPTALFAGLTILSHPTLAWFVTYSTGIQFLFYGRTRKSLINSLIVVMGVLLITSPWWSVVIRYHGIAPLLSVTQTRAPRSVLTIVLPLMLFQMTREPLLDLFGVLGLLGTIITIAEKELFLLVWLGSIFVFEHQTPLTLAVMPLSMLVGVGLVRGVVPMICRGANDMQGEKILRVAFVYFVTYTLISAHLMSSSSPVLSANQRSAMQWVSENTPKESRFLVIANANWWQDPTSEWFPALADRVSVNTVQGYEWDVKMPFSQRVHQYNALQECAEADDSICLENWENENDTRFTHIYINIANSDTPPNVSVGYNSFTAMLKSSPNYSIIYDGPETVIFFRQEDQ